MSTDIEIRSSEWSERARALRSEGWVLADLCGLDRMHLGHDVRFGIVVQLLHRERKERQTLHIAAEGDPPTLPSIVSEWPGANFFEREAYDMFGIVFDGHPNLTRILMPDEWEGHPLRKDYSVGKVPVDFVPQPLLQVGAPGQAPHARAAGVRTDHLGQAIPDEESADGEA